MLKHSKYVDGACFCDSLYEYQEYLLVAERGPGTLCEEARRVLQPELEPALSAGPRTYLVAQSEQREALPLESRMYASVWKRMTFRQRASTPRPERRPGVNKCESDVPAALPYSRDPAHLDCSGVLDAN